MRLIDANKLEEKVREYFKKKITAGVYEIDTVNCSVNICRMIEEQPTIADENGFRAESVEITEEMVSDFWDCKKKAETFGDGKDCDTCSWHNIKFDDVCACELEGIEECVEKVGGRNEQTN